MADRKVFRFISTSIRERAPSGLRTPDRLTCTVSQRGPKLQAPVPGPRPFVTPLQWARGSRVLSSISKSRLYRPEPSSSSGSEALGSRAPLPGPRPYVAILLLGPRSSVSPLQCVKGFRFRSSISRSQAIRFTLQAPAPELQFPAFHFTFTELHFQVLGPPFHLYSRPETPPRDFQISFISRGPGIVPPRALQVAPLLSPLEHSRFHLFWAPLESSMFHLL